MKTKRFLCGKTYVSIALIPCPARDKLWLDKLAIFHSVISEGQN